MTQLSERRITNGDFKRIYLPIGDWDLIPPSEDIYDEPVFYYKANYKWAALIEGFVSWLTEITAWKNAEDENYSGIQSIMQFLERIVIEIDCAQVEDCLGSSAIINQMITNITNNATNITNNTTIINEISDEVDVIQEQQFNRNDVPLVSTYADDDLCNAADYAAQKVIDNAISAFNSKNSTNFGAWIENILDNSGGWIGNALELVWNTLDGSYAPTVAELIAANPYVVDALYGANLDRVAAQTAVLNDTNISAHAKSTVAAILGALTDSQIASWALVGKSNNSGGCIATTSWQWKYSINACTYALPIGWTLNIGAASCGDGPGSADGIYRSRNGAAAEINAIINLPSSIQIDSVRVNALCNLGGGYTAGTIICTVNNAGVEVFRNSRTMPLTGFTVHNFTPVVTGNQIIIYSVQNYSGVNPVLLDYNNMAVNAALL